MINPIQIKRIEDMAGPRFLDILVALGIDITYVSENYTEIRMACPLHEGDNPTGFVWYIEDKRWKCFTKRCNDELGGSSIFTLVEAILNKSKPTKFLDAVRWVADFVGIKIDEQSVVNKDEADILASGSLVNIMKKNKNNDIFPTLASILPYIQPDTYFLRHGITENTIRKFHIGYCDTPGKPMYQRSFAPVLSEDGEFIIGVSGRSIFEQCPKCKYYHNPEDRCHSFPKWRHTKFSTSEVLYNLWNAKDYITKTNCCITVEGPKDVWALDQAGIPAVSIFGLQASISHRRLLQKYGCLTVIALLDNDEAGMKGFQRMQKAFGNSFRLFYISDCMKDSKDPADMNTAKITKDIAPVIQAIQERYEK